MKKFLAIIFLTIFAFQVLPIKAIGKILASGQMTEEVHEHGPCHKKMTPADHDKFWYLHFISTPHIDTEPRLCFKHAMRAEALINSPHLDDPLQPPNGN